MSEKFHVEKIEAGLVASIDDSKNAVMVLADKIRDLEQENAEYRSHLITQYDCCPECFKRCAFLSDTKCRGCGSEI